MDLTARTYTRIMDMLTISENTWSAYADGQANNSSVDEIRGHDQAARMYTLSMVILTYSDDTIRLRGGTF